MSQHLLLYTDDFGSGGVAQYNHEVVLGLRAQDYRVTLVQTQVDTVQTQAQARAGVVHEWLDYNTISEVQRTLDDTASPERIFHRVRPDFILFSDSHPLSNFAAKQVAIQQGIPYAIVIGYVAPDLAERFGDRLDALSEQYHHAREVILVSQENLQLLRQHFRLPDNKGRVILYGRPAEFFEPRNAETRQRLRAELGIKDDQVLCFSVAQIVARKGFQLQLGAIAQLRHLPVWSSLQFAWAGSGDPALTAQYEKEIAEMGASDRVHLLGRRWDIQDWYDAADMFLLPSWREGMPLAIMEAMAKGLPVAASAVSGIPEELGETGKLLSDPNQNPVQTIADLVDIIQTWALHPEQRRAAGEGCRQRAINLFQQHRMLDETISLLADLMLPAGDYVSPGLALVRPDHAFPNKIVGNCEDCGWPYLRREVPHNWYVDRRHPVVGFLSRDEAHILYNTALQFRGQRALEIGCWMGWSACHLALAGVELDVVDPLLERPEFFDSVSQSLTAAGVRDRVALYPGFSPGAVQALAAQEQRRWSLIFIDGNHEAPGPLEDAIACELLATEDALIIFHDLSSPDVAQGLDYLRDRGWNTLVYQTMQIMGVAWRGNVKPIHHTPDPAVSWTLPAHLKHYTVSGWQEAAPTAHTALHALIQMAEQVEALPPVAEPISQETARAIATALREGQAAYVAGNWDTALDSCHRAIEQGAGAASAHAILSNLYGQRAQLQASVQHFAWANTAHTTLGKASYAEFQELVQVVRPYTLLSEERLFSLYALTRQICLEDLPGNIVECGTFKGGAAALIAAVVKRYSQRSRKLYACDTFEGMPDPVEVDKHNGVPANDTDWGAGTLKAPIEENLAVVCQALDVQDIVVPVKGLFQDTLPEYRAEMGDIALLHADGDWYESTLAIFNLLYHQVIPGGAVQIDDYGFWEGCRQAIHEFERQQRSSFALRRIDSTGVWFRKSDAIAPAQDYGQLLCQLGTLAYQLGDRPLATAATAAALRLVPNLLTAELIQQQLQQSQGSALQQVRSAIARYQSAGSAADRLAALERLRQHRYQLIEQLLNIAPEDLETAFAGELGQAHRLILDSGIRLEPLTETDEAIALQLIATLSEGWANQTSALLAAMLYCYPHHLPDGFDPTLVPPSLLADIVRYLCASPTMFMELGEADEYAKYLERWVDRLYEQVQNDPTDFLWQKVAQVTLQTLDLTPLYLTRRSLKSLCQKRSALIAQALTAEGAALDYDFPVAPEPRQKLRLGILSPGFIPQTKTAATLPVFRDLNRDQFEVILFSQTSYEHPAAQYCLQYADRAVQLPGRLAEQVDVLRQADLDILWIATNTAAVTDSITLLASHRLARVQVCGMNSPISSGIAQIDYWLTSRLAGSADQAQRHFTEHLLPLEAAGQCFDLAVEGSDPPTEPVDRAMLGIADNEVVFVSGASFYKISPELEAAWAEILASVPGSRLLIYPFNPNYSNQYPLAAFQRRLSKQLTARNVEGDRLLILGPTPSRANLQARVQLADVYLDSFPMSGLSSLLDPLMAGVPTLVMEQDTPVSLGRGAAFLRELELPELIATTVEEYVTRAIALGTDAGFRKKLSDRLQTAMQQTPSFLDSKRYGQQMSRVLWDLYHSHQQRQLAETLHLRDRNLIALPDWQQPEDVLFAELADLLRTVITAPGGEETTLLVDMGDLDAQEADFALSSVTLHLMEEEELELGEDAPEITLLPPLPADQWTLLRPRLTARIDLPHNNTAAIARAALDTLPTQSVG
ncbi:glycosyltransferase [Thermoleptolyngbya oregonensis NK1-22]|uniref:Glycosyltransferase n=1 Tax=Thermoleptolyngbya oregonensis NK1-22 TaxID=2547457 RepID=A0AA97BNE3_9CYAN|nr:glycosyltransferase [Thermoleptolyngbya oregonensis NK1-22]